ncbi:MULTISPECIES: anion permease [unclassified Breznakia]|uniref:SLC13 family permease n=1 Tax=unclassified Breznakia TaxID=2623764 RepID=UPI0024764E1F|nr:MULTISPECIES: anion permease [unclassified Breznakia]MDH6365902.1 sodium-dependent dicarboxylate transporter 2/3/5 [Breznakia sp. PH1-1]MDH6403166.1 sodium-dependent dicarboxylate transporter 2/3/5 [Breznakia sp. PF1-11]MDH6410875.1 sodium-dependent dicarboxylate transporter 2/3/5 [Breznakia sp. PFB1-11]MDH6413068.1 sodium-dependent dicarboxylate transporter 2/3/5 [Breznakia sp. PFB1-14]MDH6415436.1 sodium-dependent dicarboxylate transporter 2/3/5 [Breznakia sp. PFB1-4]
MKNRKLVVSILAFIGLFVSANVPLIDSLSQEANFTIGIFVCILVLWLFIGFDWPSLLCIACIGLLPSVGLKGALATSFGSSSFVFLMFTFLCTYALTQTSFIPRVSKWFLSLKLARKGAVSLSTTLFLSVLVLGCFISPSVLFFTMYPLVKNIYKMLGLKKGDAFSSMLLIGVVGSVSLASGMTPISHAFPVAALSIYETLTGHVINYVGYMMFAIPTGILIFIVMLIALNIIYKPKTIEIPELNKDELFENTSTTFSVREKIIIAVFFSVVLLWVLPSMISPFFPAIGGQLSKLGTALPPMFGTVILCVVRIDDKPLLNLQQGMANGISWNTLFMSASANCLAVALVNDNIGIPVFLRESVLPDLSVVSPLIIVAIFVIWGSIQSNFTAHLLTAQLTTSVAIQMLSTNNSVHLSAIVAITAFASSLGFTFPSSMPYVAEAHGSGWVIKKDLLRLGVFVCIVAVLVTITVAYPLALHVIA